MKGKQYPKHVKEMALALLRYGERSQKASEYLKIAYGNEVDGSTIRRWRIADRKDPRPLDANLLTQALEGVGDVPNGMVTLVKLLNAQMLRAMFPSLSDTAFQTLTWIAFPGVEVTAGNAYLRRLALALGGLWNAGGEPFVPQTGDLKNADTLGSVMGSLDYLAARRGPEAVAMAAGAWIKRVEAVKGANKVSPEGVS